MSIKTKTGTITVSHGTVTVNIPAHLTLPAQAGKLSPKEVQRVPKTPRGIGLISNQVAAIVDKDDGEFTLPKGVTAVSLRTKGQRAEDIDDVIADLEVVLVTLKQANLLFDADAWDHLRAVNDQVKVQSKRNKKLLATFKPLIDYLAKGPRAPKQATPVTK